MKAKSELTNVDKLLQEVSTLPNLTMQGTDPSTKRSRLSPMAAAMRDFPRLTWDEAERHAKDGGF